MKPVILITPTTDKTFYKLNHAYAASISAAGGTPILSAYNISYIPKLLAMSHGILISGGGDIHARYFHEPLHPKADFIFPERDEFELALITEALAADKPMLCICRGMQVLNVALGGNIIQHIENHSQQEERHVATHQVTIYPHTLFSQIWNTSTLMVNSFHHQALGHIATGLQICAVSPDGIVEGICHQTNRFVVGVQWHPEAMAIDTPEQFTLFQQFIAACI